MVRVRVRVRIGLGLGLGRVGFRVRYVMRFGSTCAFFMSANSDNAFKDRVKV